MVDLPGWAPFGPFNIPAQKLRVLRSAKAILDCNLC